MNPYGLDPAWYFSAPGLAWDAALKTSRDQHELLSDADMLLMIESRSRGGIATTRNIWELSSILLRNLNSSHI